MKFKPAPRLTQFVESIWIQESSQSGQKQPTRLLPVGKIDLLFNYGDPFVVVSDGMEQILPTVQIVGQRTRAMDVRATGKTALVIVSLYPHCIQSFFRPPAQEFTDSIFDMSLLIKSTVLQAAMEKLSFANNHLQRIELIQNFLFRLFKKYTSDFLIYEAINRLNQANGNVTITELSKMLNISRRHLSRRFRHIVGVCPKTFANIIRFQKSLGYKRLGQNWQAIMQQCGYYDQAHFIREFKTFSGYAPTSFPNETLSTPLMRSFNRNELSHFYNTIYL